MALAPNEILDSQKLSFRCPKCHSLAIYSVTFDGSLVPSSQGRSHAGAVVATSGS